MLTPQDPTGDTLGVNMARLSSYPLGPEYVPGEGLCGQVMAWVLEAIYPKEQKKFDVFGLEGARTAPRRGFLMRLQSPPLALMLTSNRSLCLKLP